MKKQFVIVGIVHGEEWTLARHAKRDDALREAIMLAKRSKEGCTEVQVRGEGGRMVARYVIT